MQSEPHITYNSRLGFECIMLLVLLGGVIFIFIELSLQSYTVYAYAYHPYYLPYLPTTLLPTSFPVTNSIAPTLQLPTAALTFPPVTSPPAIILTMIPSHIPTLTSTPTAPIITTLLLQTLAIGKKHTCALQVDQTVYCVGNGLDGQLANGLFSNMIVPVKAIVSENISEITAGEFFTCFLTQNSSTLCSGNSDMYQLGTNSTNASNVPLFVISDVNTISSGDGGTCIVTNMGAVKCWGKNTEGELGTGTITNVVVPTVVTGFETFGAMRVSIGFSHGCVLDIGGVIHCSGRGVDGQLGDGLQTPSTIPVQAYGLTNQVDVQCGSYHTCSIANDGLVRCWGSGANGQLGTGDVLVRTVPAEFALFSFHVQYMSSGDGSTCALLFTLSKIECVGKNVAGQHGTNSTHIVSTTFDTFGVFEDYIFMQNKYERVCGMRPTGEVFCAGTNDDGQLGDGNMPNNAHIPIMMQFFPATVAPTL